jgi:hypothetical protein
MPNPKRIFSLAVLLLLAFHAFAQPTLLSRVVSLRVTPADPVVQVTGTLHLSAIGTLANGTTTDLTSLVTWSSSNSAIASVDTGGLVFGVHVGSVRIDAAYGALIASGALSVPGMDTTGFLNHQRESHTASTLVDGRVLVLGGWNAFSQPGSPFDTNPASTEIYDPATGLFSAGPTMSVARAFSPRSVTLPNGWVLVVGGKRPCTTGSNMPEIFDAASMTFTAITAPSFYLNYAAAVLESDGSSAILIGGQSDCPVSPVLMTSIDRFNPATAHFSHITNIPFLFQNVSGAVVLEDGRIWIFDGAHNGMLNPKSGVFTMLPDRPYAIADAVVLNGGNVLALSMLDGIVNHAALLDPATGTWTPVADPPDPRSLGKLKLMQNGRVNWEGGVSPFDGWISNSDEFDPVGNTFIGTGNGTLARASFTVSLLQNGEVLTIGGRGDDITLNRADVYQSDLLTPEGLISIHIVQPKGPMRRNTERHLLAVGKFSDGHTANLHAVRWDLGWCHAATITADGYAWGRSAGVCHVTASAGTVSTTAKIHVH